MLTGLISLSPLNALMPAALQMSFGRARIFFDLGNISSEDASYSLTGHGGSSWLI